MAVVLCPDCKKEISDTAKVCPNCGYPYGKNLTLYTTAKSLMKSCSTSTEYLGAAELFHSIRDLLDAEELERICRENFISEGLDWEQESGNMTAVVFCAPCGWRQKAIIGWRFASWKQTSMTVAGKH